jgi:CRP/FNR family transcriptional regulator, cyclic AMP receptor protein
MQQDDFLAHSRWASAISTEELQRARAAISVREVQAGHYVCRKGDPSDVWIGVVDGLIKIENLSDTGKLVNFGTFPANSWFGEGSILKRELRKYDVIALHDSRVALMSAATFFWLLDKSIPFNRFIITQLNERLGQYLGAFEHDRLEGLDARVAHSIADMLHPQLHPRPQSRIEITNEELGNLVGVSRQSINQSLHLLENLGLIKTAYRTITVLDFEGLRNFGTYCGARDGRRHSTRINTVSNPFRSQKR